MNTALILVLFSCQFGAVFSVDCAVNNGGCEMICSNQACSCFNNYVLADNGLNCLDCTVRSRLINAQSLDVVPNSNQAACDTECSNNIGCAVSALNKLDSCVLFASPIIYVSYDTTEQDCIDECSQRANCLTLNHGTYGDCYLFDVTYGAIPDASGWSIRGDGSYTVIEKGLCPSVL